MDNVLKISLLLDFYSQFMTERQYSILDMHYNNDYSLGEIAEYLNISRQGVYDNIKRGKALLNTLEEKLGLAKKYLEQKQKLENILETLNSLDVEKMDAADREKIKHVENEVKSLIDNL